MDVRGGRERGEGRGWTTSSTYLAGLDERRPQSCEHVAQLGRPLLHQVLVVLDARQAVEVELECERNELCGKLDDARQQRQHGRGAVLEDPLLQQRRAVRLIQTTEALRLLLSDEGGDV